MQKETFFQESLKKYSGMQIKCISVSEDTACFVEFDNGKGIFIHDAAQYCCEERWMTCDDDLNQFIGASLLGAEELEVENLINKCEHDERIADECFLRVDTTQGSFRLCMHNQHNGYYGGFRPTIYEKICQKEQ